RRSSFSRTENRSIPHSSSSAAGPTSGCDTRARVTARQQTQGHQTMSETPGGGPAAIPPHGQLVQMAMGHWISRIIHLGAKLGVADRLADGPKTADEIAGATGMHAPSLYRLMRTLSSLGVLSESTGTQRFALTPLGEALKKNAPGAAHASVLTIASDWWFRGFGELEYSVATGKSGFEKALGMPIFDYLAQNPDEASRFTETMVGFHGAEPAAVAAADD